MKKLFLLIILFAAVFKVGAVTPQPTKAPYGVNIQRMLIIGNDTVWIKGDGPDTGIDFFILDSTNHLRWVHGEPINVGTGGGLNVEPPDHGFAFVMIDSAGNQWAISGEAIDLAYERGEVDTAGTPVTSQIGFFKAPNKIGGDAGFKFSTSLTPGSFGSGTAIPNSSVYRNYYNGRFAATELYSGNNRLVDTYSSSLLNMSISGGTLLLGAGTSPGIGNIYIGSTIPTSTAVTGYFSGIWGATRLSTGIMINRGLPYAPGSPSEGWSYYNYQDNKMYLYDGTDWVAMGATTANITGTTGQIGYYTGTNILGGSSGFMYTGSTVTDGAWNNSTSVMPTHANYRNSYDGILQATFATFGNVNIGTAYHNSNPQIYNYTSTGYGGTAVLGIEGAIHSEVLSTTAPAFYSLYSPTLTANSSVATISLNRTVDINSRAYTGTFLKLTDNSTVTSGSNTGKFVEFNNSSTNVYAVNKTGQVKATQLSGALTDNAPTYAEITAIVGMSPATATRGYQVTIQDTNGTQLLYKIESNGTEWYYTVMNKAYHPIS